MYVVRRWHVAAALLAASIGAGRARAEATTQVALGHGDREGLVTLPAVLALDAAASPSIQYPFAREGRYRSLPQPLTDPPASVVVRVRGTVPPGTAVRLHLRT